MLGQKKFFSFRSLLFLTFSFFSVVSLTYAATTIGNDIFTSGTITSQGKAYLTGGVSTPVLNATSSLIDDLSVNNLRATSTLDYWLTNAPTTDNLREGTTNLYYTNQRVADYVNNNSFLTVSTTNLIAQNALLSQATIPTLYATSSLIDSLTAKNISMFSNSSIFNTKNDLGIIYKNNLPFVYTFGYGWNGTTFPNGLNFFAGYNAGNTSMGSTATGAFQSSFNTGVGDLALQANTTGYNNTALGLQALTGNSSGSGNTGIGTQALFDCGTGYNNTAVGSMALYGLFTGYDNTAVGRQSLYLTTGSYNTALGAGSLWNNNTGYNNIALGFDALFTNTTGYNNIGIGYHAAAAAATDNNEIVIGNNATGAGSNSVVLGNDSITKTLLKGKIGIASTTPEEALTVGGNIYASGTVTSTNMSLIKVKFTPSPTPTNPVIGDCFMDNGAKPQINCYDGANWHPLW